MIIPPKNACLVRFFSDSSRCSAQFGIDDMPKRQKVIPIMSLYYYIFTSCSLVLHVFLKFKTSVVCGIAELYLPVFSSWPLYLVNTYCI